MIELNEEYTVGTIEQLKEWVNGISIHNTDRDECCPDFSCCDDEVDTPLEIRRAFVDANEKDRHKMLVMFLGDALKNENVYIAKGDE